MNTYNSLSILPPVTVVNKYKNMMEANSVCTLVCLLVTLDQLIPFLQEVFRERNI